MGSFEAFSWRKEVDSAGGVVARINPMGKTRGRPVKAPENRRSVQVCVQLTESERQVVTEAARRTGLSVSEWARRRMLFGTVMDVT